MSQAEKTFLIHPRYRIPVYLSLALCAILCLTMNQYGMTGDEIAYSPAGRIYLMWAEHPFAHNNRLDATWSYNHEHPPFGKILGGLAERLFHDGLGTVGLIKAFRLQNLIYCFALSFVMYLWVTEIANKYIGILAVLITFFLPRMYFTAHIADLDYPVTILMFVTAYAFWKGLQKPKYMMICSVLMGLALLTKINAVFLFAFLGVWLIAAWRKQLKSQRVYIVSFALIPPAMFVAFWPWLWPHPISRTIGYVTWLMRHFPLDVYYLGRTYSGNTPWHYPLVLSFITLPVVILAAIVYYIFRARKRTLDLFLACNVALPILLIALFCPCTSGGVRLFLPAFPFLCMFAALGIHQYLSVRTSGRVTALILVLGLAAAFAVGAYGRYQECYYNELVAISHTGSLFETEYTGCPIQEVIPWMNEHPGARFCQATWLVEKYKIFGNLSGDTIFTDYATADYLILPSQEGRFDDVERDYYLHKTPVVAVREGNGLLLLGVYKK